MDTIKTTGTKIMSTHRALQLSVLLDSLMALVGVCARAAANLASIGNHKGAAIELRRSVRAARMERSVRARLDRDEAMLRQARWNDTRSTCGSRIVPALHRRPANALNIEIGQAADRCINRQPSEWRGRGASSLRWLASGGDALVFGVCSRSGCPGACK